MTPLEIAFLEADFNWVSTLQSVWRDPPSHVETMQKSVVDRVLGEFQALKRPDAGNAIGQVVNGPAGSGKTHLIGTLRRKVWEQGGWFVLIDIVGIKDFWSTCVFGFIRSLRQAMPGGQSQYQAVFSAALKRVPHDTIKEVAQNSVDLGSGAIRTVNAFVRILQTTFPEALQYSNVIRALLLQGDPDAAEIAYGWLQGLDIDPEDRKKLGLTSSSPNPQVLVSGICWLMSLSGPIMIAIDQIDAIVTAGNIIADRPSELDDETEARARAITQILAGGLMDLYDQTTRAMTVVTCLTETWDILCQKALKAATHRFAQAPLHLNATAMNPDTITALISGRLATAFARHGVEPQFPTWPFRAEALAQIEGLWPRQVLMRCEDYRRKFIGADHVMECASLLMSAGGGASGPDLGKDFERYRTDAKIADLASGADDGSLLGACLRDMLQLYAKELTLPESVDVAIAALPSDARPALHTRLTFTFHDQNELEKHYCFRAIGHANAIAVQARLRAAMTDSGIDKKLPFRHLFILRNDPMPSGRVTAELVERLRADGGRIVPLGEDDLRIFVALRDMQAAKIDSFETWLRERKPLCDTTFFQTVGLCPPPVSAVETRTQPDSSSFDGGVSALAETPPDRDVMPTAAPPGPIAPKAKAAETPAAIPLGNRLEGGAEGRSAELPTALLTRHTAIFAGSGSGKTVLLRRLVEEAALLGIPAIVLDTNNDLARLGQPWPQRPDAFNEVDAAKAARYRVRVEVVVWTPGAAGGRPLTLAVLPDFAAVSGGEEREQAVDMAWATLVPLVGAGGASKVLKEGLLKEALAAFARGRAGGIERFIEFLADLPADVSHQRKAQKLAADMADQLRGRIAVNPLLNAKGQPLDPAVLFKSDAIGKTRISVINFAGLLADESRQDFVNQLQMALFTFIRKHPSETPRLYVLDEAQNFAPSQSRTASKSSAMALAAQARKFGLGMIFATQAPKGIDTKIVSNCTTHFYGRMSSPALIEATEEMMAARGKAAGDLGTLSAGRFYYSTEGMSTPVKIRTPLCLSYHPQNPATPEEILSLAKPTR